jgi:hypothetical protein
MRGLGTLFGDELGGAAGRSAPLLVLGALLAGGLAGREGRPGRIAIGLRLLGLASVRVANLLPAVVLAPSAPAWWRRSAHPTKQPTEVDNGQGGLRHQHVP